MSSPPITVSEVMSYLTCPTKAHYAHRELRGLPPRAASLSIRFGTFWHQFMAAKLTARQCPEKPPEFVTIDKDDEDLLLEIKRLEEYYKYWDPPMNWIVKAVEVPLNAPIGTRYTVAGRLDGIVGYNGYDWSLQWKSCGPSENIPTLCEKVRMGFHECVYQRLAEMNRIPLRGTILGVLKRYSNKAIAEGALPLTFHLLPRERDEVDERFRDFLSVCDDIHAERHRIKNVSACHVFGRCQYYDVCHNGASISEAPFVDLPNRYEDLDA